MNKDCPDEWLYEYAVVRYVPRIDREEFLNIGLIMMCKRKKWLRGMILIDEERIKSFYPACNLQSLKQQTNLFERKDVPSEDLPVEEKYRWLTAAKSAMLQTSASHPGILSETKVKKGINLLDQEFDRLFESLVLI